MIVSIVIVILAVLFGSLSIVAQYTKDRDRRRNIESVASIPAGLALYGIIAWLMSHAHHLNDLGVSTLALVLAFVFFLLVPAVTYIFSPAFKDASDDSRRPQSRSRD